jgi:methylated-DNA-[protein]-cysteine S-methyltransferase
LVATPAGVLTLIFDIDRDIVFAAGYQPIGHLIVHIEGPYSWRGELKRPPAALLEAFEAYGDGQVDGLDGIVGRQPGGTFRQNVWRTLRDQHLPVSYGHLAELAGYPRAARAVGTACAANLLGLIVPCHRVIKADGGIGSYGYGDGDGVRIKRRLLAHESGHRRAPAGQAVS